MIDTVENFIDFLGLKQLSDDTIRRYVSSYRRLHEAMEETGYPLDQNMVNAFLIRYKSNVERAFILNFIEFMERNDLKIMKVTGSKGIRKKRQIRTVPEEHRKKIFTWLYIHNPKVALIMELIYQCALRRGEINRIIASDFMWSDRFEDELGSPIRLLIHGKYTRERFVYVPRILAEAIREFIRINGLKSNAFVFPICRTTLTSAWHEGCRNAVGRTYNIHALRHTKSTEWYEEGKDIFRIQKRLGHASISTTQLYINPDERGALEEWKHELMKKG